jgi:hypothetical protein
MENERDNDDAEQQSTTAAWKELGQVTYLNVKMRIRRAPNDFPVASNLHLLVGDVSQQQHNIPVRGNEINKTRETAASHR